MYRNAIVLRAPALQGESSIIANASRFLSFYGPPEKDKKRVHDTVVKTHQV